jgi:hypothetical protein
MSIGSRPRSFRACGLALVLAVGGCGSDDQGAAQDSGTTSEATATVGSAADEAGEQDAGLGGAGHWTAGQLCALNDLASMSVLHPGVEVIEETGLDEADSAVCLWSDRAFDPIDSAGRLFIVSQMLHDGATFSDSFETIDVAGAEQAVFAETLYSERLSAVLVAVGDRSLSVEFVQGTDGGRELAELVASVWASMQTA